MATHKQSLSAHKHLMRPPEITPSRVVMWFRIRKLVRCKVHGGRGLLEKSKNEHVTKPHAEQSCLMSRWFSLWVARMPSKVVNGYGKSRWPKTDSFSLKMIGCSDCSDRNSSTVEFSKTTWLGCLYHGLSNVSAMRTQHSKLSVLWPLRSHLLTISMQKTMALPAIIAI